MTSNSEPPYLSIGTAVSAKYRGAFCEAIVTKIVKSVKCRVFLKETQSNLLVTDEYITGPLEVGATVEVKHPDTERLMEATIKQLSDSSMYTVVFDDNDERTLRRTQLCLKGDKHFVESETLDNHPLSNPEHFGTPVIVRGKRSRSSNGTCSNQGGSGSSSEEEEVEEESPRKTYRGKTQELVGKLMFYESDDRKKSVILPVLVVLPDANPIELKTKDHVLIRSFKDNKFFSVAKKDLLPFSREVALKNEEKSLKPAMEKALLFVDNRELPLSWNKEELLGVDEGQQEAEVESDDDEEQTEDKDRFVAQLYKFSDDRGTPINKGPTIGSKDLNLYKLFKIVHKLGGYNRVTNQMRWRLVYSKMLLPPSNTASTQIKNAYKKYLHAFEDFYRKLGSSMGTVSRPSRNRNDTGRSLVAFRGRDLAKNLEKAESDKEKVPEDTKSEFESAAESMLPKEGTPKKNKSARVKAEFIKELPEEKPDIKSVAAEVKKEEIKKDIKAVDKKKDMKKVEKCPKKALVRKIRDDKKEVKSAEEMKEVNRDGDKVEKRVLKKKEDRSVKEKKEIQEEFKNLQRKQRRSAVKLDVDVDSKMEKMENVKDKREEFKVEKVEIRNEMEERQKEEIRKDKTELKIEEVLKKEEITDTKEEVIEKVEEHCEDKDNKKETQADKIEKKAKKKKAKLDEIGDKDTRVAANVQSSEDLPVGAKLRVQCGKGKNASQYEAKILEVGLDPGPRQYLVHYKGWNNRHDEWIKADRIVYVLAKPSDGKKKHRWRPFSKPEIKKKTLFDKPPTSPSSVKSDSSVGQGLGQHGDKSNKSSPAASTCHLRSTRSHSIELLTDGPPGSENENSDKSDDDSELDKTLDKSDEMESSQKSCCTLLNESEKQKDESSDIDSNIGIVSLNLVMIDNTEKDKIENNEETVNKEENGEKLKVKADTIGHFCMKAEKDKFCEPILQKVETNVNFSFVKLESSCDIEKVEIVLGPEKKEDEKETLMHEKKPFLKIDELEVNTECVKVERMKEDKKTVREDDQKLEGSPYDLQDVPKVETAIKILEKKKAAVAENKEDVEKEVKEEPVKDVPTVVGDSKDDLGKDLLTKPSFNNDNEVAKSSFEVEKKGKEKRMSYSEIDFIESKKARVDAIENVLCHAGNALSVSPEKKLFVNLAEKKQIFSPIVRKLIPVSSEKCVEIQCSKFESIPEESGKEKKEIKEGQWVMDMVVVNKVSPVKKDIIIEKKVDVSHKDNGSTLKNENGEDNENNEVTSVASVKRKIRKKTKKKLEMEEIEAVTAVRKIAKRGLGTRKTKDKHNKDTESAIKVDAVEIDLHCEEQIRSRSASPEHVSSSQSFIQESQGFVPHIETIDCRISDGQCSDSFISTHNNSTKSQSSVNKSNVFENTPPTTPEHDSDDVSHPKSQNNPIKINIKTFDVGSSKIENSQPAGSESPDGNASPSNLSTGSSSGVVAGSEGSDHVPMFSVKRQQRDSDDPSPTKRRKRSSRVKSSSCRVRQFGESDSEDTNMSLKSRSPHYTSDSYPRLATNIQSPRPPKYNFNLEDGKYLEGTARISFLVQKITEIRKLYMNLKSEVACIDRRRKKLKRKEKERETQNSSTLQMECL